MPFFFLLLLTPTTAPPPPPSPPPPRICQFKPGIAIIVALLTTIFSITFLLLLYMKHCKRDAYVASAGGNSISTTTASSSYYHQTTSLGRRNSGVDRKVIESLPIFRFASLTGQKDGLECAVCLNRFEPEDVLRLLPKCKHAFHLECVDTWLDAHSTCPLCRYRVDPEDILLLDSVTPYSHNTAAVTVTVTQEKEKCNRISGRHSSAGETAAPEMVSENPQRHDLRRGRVSLDSWHRTRRKLGKGGENQQQNQEYWKMRKDGQLMVSGKRESGNRRLEHRIVISSSDLEGGRGQRRWSDAQAAEILYLKSEKMMMVMIRGSGNGRGVNNERCASEITGVSRYVSNYGGGGGDRKLQLQQEQGQEEERVIRRWLDWISSQSNFNFNSNSNSQTQSHSQLVSSFSTSSSFTL